MTVVAIANVAGQACGAPVRLVARRRRLSTILARHHPAGRTILVSLHRGCAGEPALAPCDATVRLRAIWGKTLVGPRDVVLITVLPLGGGRAGGAGKSGVGIGLALASIALIALAPYAAPALAGSLLGLPGAAAGTLASSIQVGMVVGGLALGYAAQAATAARKSTPGTLYSVTGGGNVPKPNARKPLIYGQCWTSPPLSQRDYFRYDGDTMVLTKRMTLGLGKFQVQTVKVGDAVFWTAAGGIQAPFNASGGDAASATAIEILYEQASTLAVGDAIASGSVAGQELPRVGANPSVTPWFRLTPQGVVASSVLLSWSYPSVSLTNAKGEQKGGYAGVVFTARRIDPTTGAVIGQPFELLRDAIGPVITTTAVRASRIVRLPAEGAYEVCGQNIYPVPTGFTQQNTATWDELTALKDDTRIRPATTEIVMRVRAGPGLTITAFSDVTVQATRILPVWTGSAWVEQPTRKAVWAWADLVRAAYGLALDAGADAAKALYYAGLLSADDTFDGQLPDVASFAEAAALVLAPMRADPVKVGAVHSFVRDESRDDPRRVLTRRQIVRDSGSASFRLAGAEGGGDVIVEFDRDGDPRRPDEARYSYGAPSRTPKRYKVPGIAGGDHALRHAKWLALVALFRGALRTVVTEWDGRLIYPGDHLLSDLWYLKGKGVFGVAGLSGSVLQLDCDANVPATWGYASIRTRQGREWGIVQVRGQGVRGLEVDAGDLATLQARTGLSLAQVLASDTQDPTTVVLGDLVELQETYVARAALPTDADHVRIEMVQDDARIWTLLGEAVVGPVPVSNDTLAEPLIPSITVLHARCARIETGIEVAWSVAPARGARSYAVWLSYDGGATREPLSTGPAVSGTGSLHQSDTPVTVIAVAYGRTGLPSAEISTTFSTVAPVVQGSVVDITTLPLLSYANLGPDVTGPIAAARAAADKAAADAQAGIAAANNRLDSLRRSLAVDPTMRAGYVDPLIGDLRQTVAIVTDAVLRMQRDQAVLQDRMAAAGIEVLSDQGIVRIAAVAQVQSQLSAVSITLDALAGKIDLYGSVQTGDLSGLITSISTVRETLDALTATVSTLATSAQYTEVSTRLSSAEQTIAANTASISAKASQTTVDAQGTRLSSVESGLFAAQGRISSVVTQIGTGGVDTSLLPGLVARLDALRGQQIDALAAQVARAETASAANIDEAGRSVAELSGRLLAFQGDAAAQFATVTRTVAGQDYALVQTQTTYDAAFRDVRASVASEVQARGDAIGAQASRTDGLAARMGAAEAAQTSEVAARVSADSALSGRIDTNTARLGTAESNITGLSQTVASNASSTATQFQGVTARLGTNEANITSLSQTVASNAASTATQFQGVTARLGTNEANITSLSQTVASNAASTATQFQGVTARFGTNEANITSNAAAIGSVNSAMVSRTDDLYARSNLGTAYGRFYMEAASAPSGVSARLAATVSVDSYGARRNAGWFIDMLPDV